MLNYDYNPSVEELKAFLDALPDLPLKASTNPTPGPTPSAAPAKPQVPCSWPGSKKSYTTRSNMHHVEFICLHLGSATD